MGFVSPTQNLIADFQVEKDSRGNVKASDNGLDSYKTNRKNVFAAGDVRRGQSWLFGQLGREEKPLRQ